MSIFLLFIGNIVRNDGDMTALKKLNFKDEIYCFKSSHVFSQIKFTCPNFFDTSVNNVEYHLSSDLREPLEDRYFIFMM